MRCFHLKGWLEVNELLSLVTCDFCGVTDTWSLSTHYCKNFRFSKSCTGNVTVCGIRC